MRRITKAAIAAMSLVVSGPVLAQAMTNHNGTPPGTPVAENPPTSADDKKIAECKAMAPNEMAKDASCVALSKDRPDVMMEGGAPNHNGTPHGAPAKPAE
jgi:hypothetical protein